MEISTFIPATTREELRNWLQENGKSESCCWVVVTMTQAPGRLLYLEAVEEALCFGWIDGVKKKLADGRLAQRLSPRSRRSSWTELNKARVRRLGRLGLMTDQGRKVLPAMDPESFAIDPDIERRLREDEHVYANFAAFPDLYKRVRIDTIQSCRNQPELFEHRLAKFIANTRNNRMYGQWHDHGRLLE